MASRTARLDEPLRREELDCSPADSSSILLSSPEPPPVSDADELTPAQLEEAERRLLAHEAEPGKYFSWEEVKRRLENLRV